MEPLKTGYFVRAWVPIVALQWLKCSNLSQHGISASQNRRQLVDFRQNRRAQTEREPGQWQKWRVFDGRCGDKQVVEEAKRDRRLAAVA